jgi:hypothetical protein
MCITPIGRHQQRRSGLRTAPPARRFLRPHRSPTSPTCTRFRAPGKTRASWAAGHHAADAVRPAAAHDKPPRPLVGSAHATERLAQVQARRRTRRASEGHGANAVLRHPQRSTWRSLIGWAVPLTAGPDPRPAPRRAVATARGCRHDRATTARTRRDTGAHRSRLERDGRRSRRGQRVVHMRRVVRYMPGLRLGRRSLCPGRGRRSRAHALPRPMRPVRHVSFAVRHRARGAPSGATPSTQAQARSTPDGARGARSGSRMAHGRCPRGLAGRPGGGARHRRERRRHG